MADQDQVFPKKYMKKLTDGAPEYTAAVDGASTDDIKKFILNSEQNLYDIEHEIDNNEDLLKVKEQLKQDMAPFTEGKNLEKAKIKYCLFTLAARGTKV